MKYFVTIFLLFFVNKANAQQKLPLYKGTVPGSKPAPASYREKAEGSATDRHISQVITPTLEIYSPAKPNGTAVIICPGGGYGILAYDKEGVAVAKRFNEFGITAFVLKYRLPSDAIMIDKSTGPLQDVLQAMYLVRKNAGAFKVNPNQIGVLGFSAGGHLAASLSSHYADMKVQNQDNISLRPDFSILIYPVISFGQYTHAGSKKNLVGDNPTDAQVKYFSNELQINSQTPPTFLVHSNDDFAVSVLNSLMYDEGLAKNNVPAEMHIYQTGNHGFGLDKIKTKDDWFARLANWMRNNKWL